MAKSFDEAILDFTVLSTEHRRCSYGRTDGFSLSLLLLLLLSGRQLHHIRLFSRIAYSYPSVCRVCVCLSDKIPSKDMRQKL